MNRLMKIRILLLSLSAVAFLAAAEKNVWAQTASARIVGTITDLNGAGVPSAKVTVVNAATQVHYDTTTNNERSEEHTSELQSPDHLVCRLLLEKKKKATSDVR